MPSPSAVHGDSPEQVEESSRQQPHPGSAQTPVGGGQYRSTVTSRRCAWVEPPSEAPRLVHVGQHPIGSELFVTVSSGRSFAQVAGAILRKQARGQNPDKDAVQVQAGLLPAAITYTACRSCFSSSQWMGLSEHSER